MGNPPQQTLWGILIDKKQMGAILEFRKRGDTMKNKWKALGKAMAYILLFEGFQGLAGIVIMIYLILSTLQKYPALLEMSPYGMVETIMQMRGPELPYDMAAALLAANILAVAAVILIFALRKKNFCREICLVKPKKQELLLALVIGLTMFCVTTLLDNLMPYSEAQWEELEENAAMLPDGISLLPMLAVALAAPVVEEIFFRGLAYTRLRRGFGVAASMVLSAVMFGLGHGGTIWFFSAAAAGLILAFALERTGSLYIPMVIHLVNNTLAQTLGSIGWMTNGVILLGAAVCLGAIWLLWKNTRTLSETAAE